jgi:hypothetical protein
MDSATAIRHPPLYRRRKRCTIACYTNIYESSLIGKEKEKKKEKEKGHPYILAQIAWSGWTSKNGNNGLLIGQQTM